METEIQYVVCPHCGNPECLEDDTYCSNCGKPLSNYCTNEKCQFSDIDSSGLRSTDVFCPDCGAPSTFYEKGVIEPRSFGNKK